MQVQVTARGFHASDELKNNVTDKTKELTRFYENIISAHVILEAEDKNRRSAELVLNARHKSIAGRGRGENMGLALDDAFSKVERQLKKLNERDKDHKQKGLKSALEEQRKSHGDLF